MKDRMRRIRAEFIVGAMRDAPARFIDPTARGDMKASLLRRWYEAHRPSWWRRRFGLCPPNRNDVADEFMLGLLQEARRIDGLCDEALARECA